MRSSIVAFAALLSGAAADCAADNCLRAFRATQTPGRLQTAQAFCATFTATSVAATAIPTWASNNCKENQNGDLNFRLSSACKCVAPATSAPATSATPTSNPTACAEVSASWAAQRAATGEFTRTAMLKVKQRTNSMPQLPRLLLPVSRTSA